MVGAAIRQAERYLAKVDPIMKRLIAKHGHCLLAEREFEPFHMLANSIISQQLSTKAAATIKQRVGVLVGLPFETSRVLSLSIEELRGAGLSQAKTRYIRELATHVSDNRLEFSGLVLLDDELVIEKLVVVPGIGRWTAEMFCCSVLNDWTCSRSAMPVCSARRGFFTGRSGSRQRYYRASPKRGGRIGRSLRGICGGRWKMGRDRHRV